MKTVSNRQLRRTVVAQQQVLEEGMAPALRAVVQNEQMTRARVAALEQWRDEWVLESAINSDTFWARLRWLLIGRT